MKNLVQSLFSFKAPRRPVLALAALMLFALIGFAPPAHAAAPTGPKDGMFDCLGEFDWGCRIVGYLFEDKGIDEGNLFTDSTGVRSSTQLHPTSAQSALKEMMRFFSNAILVIASLKLLYELIQMTAETAHTGRVGGRDTNQLWAPIRLVVAIGLLVPLASGMNTGQYIVIQIAKWGSGLGSQAWKVFAEALADKQTFAPALAPEVRSIFVDVLKVHVCQRAINYYVDKTGKNLTNERVVGLNDTSNPAELVRTYSSGNSVGDTVCGQIRYPYPELSPSSDISDRLTSANSRTFERYESIVSNKAKELVAMFTGEEQYNALPSSTVLDKIILDFQVDTIKEITEKSQNVKDQKYQEITNLIRDAASSYGWMSAGSWFLAVTRAQGQIMKAALQQPTVITPREDAIGKISPSSLAVYKEFLAWASNAARNYPTGKSGIHADIEPAIQVTQPFKNKTLTTIIEYGSGSVIANVGGWLLQKFGVNAGPFMNELNAFIKQTPKQAAEWSFKKADEIAAKYDIWQSHGDHRDPINNKAFEFGKTANPFAELASLGHRKLQSAVEFWGAALLFATQGVGAELVLRFGTLGTLGGIGSLAGTVGLGMAALFVFFSMFAFTAGLFLSFLIPLMPFIRFFYAIVTWTASIIEAMVCVPFFALAFLTPKGDGFTGPRTKFGFSMMMQILVRPALTVFGLIGALLIFYVAVKFLNTMYYETAAGLGQFKVLNVKGGEEFSGVGFLARIILGVLYVTMIYVCANMSFKMIDHIPKRALQWFGDGASEEHYEDQQGMISSMTTTLGTEIGSNVLSLPTRAGGMMRLR